MLAAAAWRTLQILFFRAGPQDFPYDQRLAWAIPLIAIAANAGFSRAVLPLGVSAVVATTIVAVWALFTRAVLTARNLGNRYQQAFNALLATDFVLKLAMLPAFYALAPKLALLPDHPELANHPEQLGLPTGPLLLANLIMYWSFAVSANIYRHAAGVGIAAGMLIAFLAALMLLFATGFASGLVRAIAG